MLLDLQNVVLVVVACCVLHNICDAHGCGVPPPDSELQQLVDRYCQKYPAAAAEARRQVQEAAHAAGVAPRPAAAAEEDDSSGAQSLDTAEGKRICAALVRYLSAAGQ